MAAPKGNALEAVMDELSAYLMVGMPELASIITDFPDANTALKYPALSITHSVGDNGFENLAPYELSRDAPNVNNEMKVRYVVGQWDYQLQLDFWSRNVPERDAIYNHFFRVFNRQIDPMGLSLQLPKYYNLWSRLDLSGFKHFDDGDSVQKGIRRTMVNLLVTTKEVLEKTEHSIETIVNNPALFDTNEAFPIP